MKAVLDGVTIAEADKDDLVRIEELVLAAGLALGRRAR